MLLFKTYFSSILGVDATQHLQFRSTGSALSSRSFKNPNGFCLAPKTLADDAASCSQIASVGSQIFVKMYDGKPSDNLDYLRYIKYMGYIATSTKTLQPERLPPTVRAAFFHSLHVHLKVMI